MKSTIIKASKWYDTMDGSVVVMMLDSMTAQDKEESPDVKVCAVKMVQLLHYRYHLLQFSN